MISKSRHTNELDIITAHIMYNVFEKWKRDGNGIRARKHIDVADTTATLYTKTTMLCFNQLKSPGQLYPPSTLTFQKQNPYDLYLSVQHMYPRDIYLNRDHYIKAFCSSCPPPKRCGDCQLVDIIERQQ